MEPDAWKTAVCLALKRQLEVTAKLIEVTQDQDDRDEDEEYEERQEELRQLQALLRTFPGLVARPQSRTPRSVWMRVRSKDWWERVVLKEFTDEEWVENFRMRRASFNKLCDLMEGVLSPQTVTVRAPIPLNMRVAIALYELATCAEYRVVANKFGVHKSTVRKFVHTFCTGMVSSVMGALIHEPTPTEARDTADRFEKKFHIPQIIGCIDATHVPITAPSDGTDFVNRKGWPSYVLQAVVDDQYRFWDISCKMPGSNLDATVLRESALHERASLLPQDPRDICGTSVGFFLVGDQAYPLTEWLMKGYISSPGITPQQESFNAYLKSALDTAEIAFGRLKSRWRVLAKRSDFHYTFSPKVIASCCALHNFCEMEEEAISPAWAEKRAPVQPAQSSCNSTTSGGQAVRLALTQYLSEHFPLRQ